MKKVIGNLITLTLQGHFDVLVHGCNCYCSMGKGIAKPISQTFPEAFDADKATTKGDSSKLGNYSYAAVVRRGHPITIVNAYTQFDFWSKGPRADYDAIDHVFSLIARDFADKRIAYPLIGAGLAGGDWERIEKSINKHLDGLDHTLVVLP